MKRKNLFAAAGVFILMMASFGLMAQEPGQKPLAVSPGGDTAVVDVWQSCPTFSWSAVFGAASYRVAIFAATAAGVQAYEEMAGIAPPVVIQDIPGPALSWTLSADRSLAFGSTYAWYVQAMDAFGQNIAGWSEGRIFRVQQEMRLVGMEQKLDEILRTRGVSDGAGSSVLVDLKAAGQEVAVPGTVSSAVAGIGRTMGTEGAESTFYGTNAGVNNSYDANRNSFFGSYAGYSTTSGTDNTFMGMNAGGSNVTGGENTMMGSAAGNQTTGNDNTFIGVAAGAYNQNGNLNTYLGGAAGYYVNGEGNTCVGIYSGFGEWLSSTGSNNTFVGRESGYKNLDGYGNVFFGFQSGYSNISGYHNTFLGRYAGYNNLTGYKNVFIGTDAGANEMGSEKLYIDNSNTATPLIYGDFFLDFLRVNGAFQINGALSMDNGTTLITASELNLLGGKTLALGAAGNDQLATKGYVDENDAVGLTGFGLTSGTVTKWDGSKLANSLIADSGTAVGVNGSLNVSGMLGIGTATPAYPLEIDTTGVNAEFIVKRTDGATFKVSSMPHSGQFGTITNHPLNLMANNVKVMTLTQQSRVGIGVTQPLYPIHMASGAYCTVGGVWTNASSRALKENIESLDSSEAMNALNKLNPVKYNYKVDKNDRHVGFIAEDVPDLVASADRKGLSPMDIVAVLTRVVQEQQKINRQLTARIEELEKKAKQ